MKDTMNGILEDVDIIFGFDYGDVSQDMARAYLSRRKVPERSGCTDIQRAVRDLVSRAAALSASESATGSSEVRCHTDLTKLAPILKPSTAAKLLDCCERTITRMCENGTLRGCRVGNHWRVNRDSLLKYAGLE